MKFHVTFRANRLHDPDRVIRLFTEEIEAPYRTSAITQLYHNYEHITVIGTYVLGEVSGV